MMSSFTFLLTSDNTNKLYWSLRGMTRGERYKKLDIRTRAHKV